MMGTSGCRIGPLSRYITVWESRFSSASIVCNDLLRSGWNSLTLQRLTYCPHHCTHFVSHSIAARTFLTNCPTLSPMPSFFTFLVACNFFKRDERCSCFLSHLFLLYCVRSLPLLFFAQILLLQLARSNRCELLAEPQRPTHLFLVLPFFPIRSLLCLPISARNGEQLFSSRYRLLLLL